MTYIPRPLGQRILDTHSSVIVLEGARAVGKTMLARKELAAKGYEYFSLAKESTYQQAKGDIDFWIRNLPRPVIIDEAQRLKSLPLAVKEIVDETDSLDPQFILTGSATLNRKGLDGQNPLTRRTINYKLYPLTKREIERTGGNVVDLLWSGLPNVRYQSRIKAQEINALLSIGGFPKYALNQGVLDNDERSSYIRSDIDNTLGDALLPGEKIDTAIANSIIRSLFSLPGNILNVARMAGELGHDSRTIGRYIDIFERRFLIQKLPNLALQAHKQTQSRPKIHPIDSSFSVEELKQAGKDVFAGNRSLLGGVLESYVACQIIPDAEWSKKRPSLFYWRQPGNRPKEVDLVLLSNNEIVGVEVKAASGIRPSDFEGLEALSSADSRFHRGYLVYTGERIVRHGENIWAIPLDALWNADSFIEEAEGKGNRLIGAAGSQAERGGFTVSATDASMFLSYCHEDNNYLNGEITQLMREIAKSYEFLYGNSLDVFVDSDSIHWGQRWRDELDRRIESCNVIVPAVTPRYMMSEACRKELLAFNEKIKSRPNCRIMPLIWQGINGVRDTSDPVGQIVEQHQYEDVESLRGADPKDPVYRKRVESLARRIHDSVVEANSQVHEKMEDEVQDGPDRVGALESARILQDEVLQFNKAFGEVSGGIADIKNAFESYPAPNSGDIDDVRKWAIEFEEKTGGAVKRIGSSLNDARGHWNIALAALSECSDFAISLGNFSDSKDQLETVYNTIVALRNNAKLPQEAKSFSSMAKTLQLISPRFRPLSNCLTNVVGLLGDIDASVSPLEARLRDAMRKVSAD